MKFDKSAKGLGNFEDRTGDSPGEWTWSNMKSFLTAVMHGKLGPAGPDAGFGRPDRSAEHGIPDYQAPKPKPTHDSEFYRKLEEEIGVRPKR